MNVTGLNVCLVHQRFWMVLQWLRWVMIHGNHVHKKEKLCMISCEKDGIFKKHEVDRKMEFWSLVKCDFKSRCIWHVLITFTDTRVSEWSCDCNFKLKLYLHQKVHRMETLSNRRRSRSEFVKSSNGETEQEQHEQGGKMVVWPKIKGSNDETRKKCSNDEIRRAVV